MRLLALLAAGVLLVCGGGWWAVSAVHAWLGGGWALQGVFVFVLVAFAVWAVDGVKR